MSEQAQDSQDQDNQALEGPIFGTFLKYLIPSVIGLLAMSTASIIDGVFIGNYVGSDALAAVNLIMPMMSFIFGFTLTLSIGGSVRAGKYIGEKNYSAAAGDMHGPMPWMRSQALGGKAGRADVARRRSGQHSRIPLFRRGLQLPPAVRPPRREGNVKKKEAAHKQWTCCTTPLAPHLFPANHEAAARASGARRRF